MALHTSKVKENNCFEKNIKSSRDDILNINLIISTLQKSECVHYSKKKHIY